VFVLFIFCLFIHSTDTFVSTAIALLGQNAPEADTVGGDEPTGSQR
jgi:hypothetical protein